MWDKLRKKAFEGCEILEFVMAMIVGLAILMAIVGVFPGLLHFWGERGDTHAFMEFLDEVLSVVIGIEFLKMLCKPSTGNIIEALIFLIARHMVIQTTTAVEDLISLSASVCSLYSGVLCLQPNRTKTQYAESYPCSQAFPVTGIPEGIDPL